MSKYPKCFPENFETDILPEGAKEENKHVYRVIKYGEINNPKAFIAYGETEAACGPCQLTSERDKSRNDTHVDWWVYDDTDPQVYFREVADDE